MTAALLVKIRLVRSNLRFIDELYASEQFEAITIDRYFAAAHQLLHLPHG
jgi:hypothetical protein